MGDFKDTLNILNTDFEMRANLPVKELSIQKMWKDNDIYQKILLKNKGKQQKTLHDGPPYANGSIHVGHALNKILKDIIVRRWNLEGFYSHYIPGWDTHGMPIEHALIKKGVNTNPNQTIAEKRENCRVFALEQAIVQQNQFARLGLETDFKDIYHTLDKNFEKHQLEVFVKAVEEGLVYQDLKPVFWSWSSQTALAEAEVEYADEESNSIYVTFEIVKGNEFVNPGEKLLVWTTTPWTLPANQAIAVNPEFVYCKVKVNNEIYICAKALIEKLKNELNWESYEVISDIFGNTFEGVTYKHMLYGTISPVISATYVIDSNGTGLVHNASGFGNDDYLACKRYGIKPYVPIDAYGKFTNESIDPELVGMFYENTNAIIIQKLKDVGALLKHEVIKHSVAHDWRTKKPVMYRATKQWFVNINKIKPGMIGELDKVNFPNSLNKTQMIDTIKNRVEWCISRQRYWGVPITIIFDENDQPILNKEVFDKIIDIISVEGSNVWFEKDATYFLPDSFDKTKSYRKETDIMDVWFDSGTTWTVLLEHGLQYPAELYLEGKDQFRGWYNSSLINSYIFNKVAPFKQLLGCGFVLDEKGMKMSKSLGNVVDPNKVCEQYGGDILRLWVASSDYTDDVSIGDNILKQIGDKYRKIRNTLFKFILANISDFDLNRDKTNVKFSEADLYILSQLKENVDKINSHYEKFNFIQIVDIINNHTIELSGWYFDIIKDTLYCDNPNSPQRRAVQVVLFHILKQYLFMLAPIIPHTCEEAYGFFNLPHKQESIFLHEHDFNLELEGMKPISQEKWTEFFKIRTTAFAKLEELRQNKVINKNTQAIVTINFENKWNWSEKELAKMLNVAKVIIKIEPGMNIMVENGNLERCERCWNYFSSDEIDSDHLCARCKEQIH